MNIAGRQRTRGGAEAPPLAIASRRPGPQAAPAVGRLGTVFHAHELNSEAISCYQRAMSLAPENARWPYLAGLARGVDDLEKIEIAEGPVPLTVGGCAAGAKRPDR